MNLVNRPDLLDRIAADYALGTLRGGARRRFEGLARQSPTARAAALIWQERLASMTELQPAAQAPSPNVWKRIENLLVADRRPVAAAAAASRAAGWWRGAALAGGLCAIVATVVALDLRRGEMALGRQLAELGARSDELARQNVQLSAQNTQLQARPEVRYVSVLHDDKAVATILATFDPRSNTITLKRVAGFQEGADRSLQLWALPTGGAPRSLGVLGTSEVEKLVALEQQLSQVPALAVSLEPKGGAPAGSGPTGPVLFKGAVLQTAI
jgi:anti-sigma-K factor RskA